MLQAIGWLAATIFFVFIEASTFNLVSVWFAVGGAAALISCIFTDSLRVQSAVFVAVSILCLLALRPLTARLRRPLTPTNGDLNVGRTATILTPVTDDAPGRARLDGVDWNALNPRQVNSKKGAYLCPSVPSSCFSSSWR